MDNFALNAGLAPLAVLIGLLGGHAFLPLRKRWLAACCTTAVMLLALLSALWWHPFEYFYTGTGMTSQRTVAIFAWLDALLICSLFLLLSAIGWLFKMAKTLKWRAIYQHALPVGLIHCGMMLALIGALAATVLDSYTQRALHYPQDFGTAQRFADGYTLQIDIIKEHTFSDGARSDSEEAFQAINTVQLYIQEQDAIAAIGNTVYRDQRQPLTNTKGPVRQLCEILDYRYARYVADGRYRLDPFIVRGFWRDIQVWVPPLDYARQTGADRLPGKITVVIKTYPLLSLLWLGLTLALIGAGLLTALAWRTDSKMRYYAHQPPR